MSKCEGGWGKRLLVVGCLFLALQQGLAQNAAHKPAAGSAQATRDLLVEKANALESRGRPDMAIQLWQEVLLSDPNNLDALAGMARDLKLTGSNGAPEALERLRRVNPNDPNLAKIQAMSGTGNRPEVTQLRQAGDLARQGLAEDAMRVYRRLYGDRPPDGDIGLAYYQTLYGTANGKQEALAGLRALAQRNPGDPRYTVQLGILLSYDQKTRAEGIRILRAHPQDADAEVGLRQALIWDSANPASVEELRAYLKDHPQDAELSERLREDENKRAQMSSGIARTPAERAAFAALNGHNEELAEKRFAALLVQNPHNGRVAAGMGFLRMQQKNFGAAIALLSQSQANGYNDRSVRDALATARFWSVMGQAAQAEDDNHLDAAAEKYRQALVMRPRSADALNAMAGLLVRQQQLTEAAGVYDQLIQAQPAAPAGWLGLFLVYVRSGQDAKALAVRGRFPASVREALAKDPHYLRALINLYRNQGRGADADWVLDQALALPFPDNGRTLAASTKLEYAAILMDAKRYDQAGVLYAQLLAGDAANLPAWTGIVNAHHALGRDQQAIDDVHRMPPATYQAALADPGFLTMLAGIYQQANQLDAAQGLLERAANLASAAGHAPSVNLQVQLAGVYLARGQYEPALALDRQVLSTSPDQADAWKGLIAALQATHRDPQALVELERIPQPVRAQLETDIRFLQSEAGLYATAGDWMRASECMGRVRAYYAGIHADPPADVQVQDAWLLFNTQKDRLLYATLLRLDARSDLTVAQREAVEDIWGNWSVRRAEAAQDYGNVQRAGEILDAAAQAFSGNMPVRKLVAGGYLAVGRAKRSLALFKTIPLQDGSVDDMQAAVGAALAAKDKSQAEQWLRQALERFPRDPAILILAGRYEQTRGDRQRAAAYYRAALAATQSTTPAQNLEHMLAPPDGQPHGSAAEAGLRRLLNPDSDPMANGGWTSPAAPGSGPYSNSKPAGPAFTPQAWHPSRLPASSGLRFERRWAAGGEESGGDWMRGEGRNRPYLIAANWEVDRRARFGLTRPLTRVAFGARLSAVAAGTGQDGLPPLQLPADAPHSPASDGWKGLVFSLMGSYRNAEALQEIARIPPAIRTQLELDIEFVQAEASLLLAVGDTTRAAEPMRRLESFYQQHRGAEPGALELQHARLLLSARDDRSLYPALLHLDARADLTAAQHDQLQSTWAKWSVERAQALMDAGSLAAGLQILQAAEQNYPDNMAVRSAMAGGYVRTARPTDALALYKTVPMQQASPSDLAEAISAALGAKDRAQAEVWLKLARARFPHDAKILALAAHFQDVRSNPVRKQDDPLLSSPPSPTPLGSDLKRLLDPRTQSELAAGSALPPANSAAATSPPGQAGDVKPHAPLAGLPYRAKGSLPPSEQKGDPAPPAADQSDPPVIPPVPAAPATPAAHSVENPNPSPNLRISSQPMGPVAAQSQALFADQTDAQLTQGSAARIHTAPGTPENAAPRLPSDPSALPSGQMIGARYTPPGQGAGAGVLSSAGQQAAPAPLIPGSANAPQCVPQTCAPARPKKPSPARPRVKKRVASLPPDTPTLDQVPHSEGAETTAQQAPVQAPAQTPVPPPAPASNAGSSNDDQPRDLAPLRGHWLRFQRNGNAISPREEAKMQLRSIESGYSGWLGGTGLVNFRSGNLGYEHLAALEAPFEASTPLGYNGRFTLVARPVFLDSGQADGSATLRVQEQTATGTALVNIPAPIGTLTATASTPPAQQNAVGIGGELQLAFPQLALAAGYTPGGFLVSTLTGRALWKPDNGPITLNLSRDSVRDTQLSYAGLRDPAGQAQGADGRTWGGVVANLAQVQFSSGDADAGFYAGVGGQYLTGSHVQINTRIDGSGGAYWRLKTVPEYGTLNVGVNFFAMHYAHNEQAFTHGMGGYFSPQLYFLANVPFNWAGHAGTRWHYNAQGSAGVQAYQQHLTPLYPLAVDKPLEGLLNHAMLPAKTSVGANYDVHSQVSYQIAEHWFAGGFFSANNTRNYSAVSAGFSVHYLFRPQPSTVSGPTGLFSADGLRPFTVP